MIEVEHGRLKIINFVQKRKDQQLHFKSHIVNFGSKDQQIQIIDNQKHIFVSLYHEKHEDNIVYYESPRYSYNKIHTIVIINHDDLPINIQEIQYRELCNYERTTYNNLDGLINITCDKLILEGSNWQRCQNARWGEPGTYTDIAGKASYKFNGTRIHILSRLEGDKRTNITIRIDNKDVANLEYLHTGATIYKVI